VEQELKSITQRLCKFEKKTLLQNVGVVH
jgi:hypothetical protein